MNKIKLIILSFLFLNIISIRLVVSKTLLNGNDDFFTGVLFPSNFALGDYAEFVRVSPLSAGASGYYEISISYTRGDIAAAATHLASISHAGPDVWREVAKINNNGYTAPEALNFTIDCNTQYGNARFRIRAINTLGASTDALHVNIKIRSVNQNSSWTALSLTGNDLTVNKFLPVTDDWNLYVGNAFTANGANLAIKAIANGNVGIGTTTPDEKLTVNGKIHAKEIKVDLNVPGPDYVFAEDYNLPSLSATQKFIKQNKHLPEIPSAKEMAEKGINLSEMNMLLLKKVEELTLHLIRQDEISKSQESKLIELENQNQTLSNILKKLNH